MTILFQSNAPTPTQLIHWSHAHAVVHMPHDLSCRFSAFNDVHGVAPAGIRRDVVRSRGVEASCVVEVRACRAHKQTQNKREGRKEGERKAPQSNVETQRNVEKCVGGSSTTTSRWRTASGTLSPGRARVIKLGLGKASVLALREASETVVMIKIFLLRD